MNLLELVICETQAFPDEVMFLRHSNKEIKKLPTHGVEIEEYTRIQPIGERYDFHHPNKKKITVLVVIVKDHVYGVYAVDDKVESQGTQYVIGSSAYQSFDSSQNTPPIQCKRFKLTLRSSIATGLQVRGWEKRERIPVQRYGDRFFNTIEVLAPQHVDSLEVVEREFRDKVTKSLFGNPDARRKRLEMAKRIPNLVRITTTVFARNADVVAEVLFCAQGICQSCQLPAPFNRRSDGSPYLEVHHLTPLSIGGEDTIENTIALCPNCHRKSHYA